MKIEVNVHTDCHPGCDAPWNGAPLVREPHVRLGPGPAEHHFVLQCIRGDTLWVT